MPPLAATQHTSPKYASSANANRAVYRAPPRFSIPAAPSRPTSEHSRPRGSVESRTAQHAATRSPASTSTATCSSTLHSATPRPMPPRNRGRLPSALPLRLAKEKRPRGRLPVDLPADLQARRGATANLPCHPACAAVALRPLKSASVAAPEQRHRDVASRHGADVAASLAVRCPAEQPTHRSPPPPRRRPALTTAGLAYLRTGHRRIRAVAALPWQRRRRWPSHHHRRGGYGASCSPRSAATCHHRMKNPP